MLLFNFLFNFINGEIYSVYLLYLFLTVLFISPFIYKWREYNKKISRLNSLKIEHELVLKYMLIKRINQYIYLKVDNFYESYILLCEKYKDQVQEFYKQSLNIKSENIIAFSSYAVKPTSEVIKDLPVTKITIDNEGTSIIASDLKNSIQNIYNLYDFIVTKNNIKLSDLIKEGKNIIYDKILSNISTTDGNYNNVADILFMNNINIKENKFKDLLDVIPPFNGILHDQNLEIIVSHSSNDNNTKNNLINFITPLSIANYNDESIPGGLTKDLNILTINTPFHGFKTIFSHNINESFYEITKDYYNQNKDGLLKILNEVYDNVIDYIANNSTDKYVSNDLKEKSYQFIFKGFDGKFEVDFINPKLDFSVEFREFNYKIIDDKISTKIKSTSK